MNSWTLWLVGLGVAVLPLVLMVAFNGADRADSRGRRTNRTWRVTCSSLSAHTPSGAE
jgi:hypothetical protein